MTRGFHYTPGHNLESIMRQGLLPGPVTDEHSVRDMCAAAIWVFTDKPTDAGHYGFAACCAVNHDADDIAVLAVEYPAEHSVRFLYPGADLRHSCRVGS